MFEETIHKPLSLVFFPVYNATLELAHLARENLGTIVKAGSSLGLIFIVASSLGHYQLALWCLRWIGLGVLSSIGFGFGMHTFVLFLAPHIAAVTLAAMECKGLNFPSPPYPHEIICPVEKGVEIPNYLSLLIKVGLESFMWGLGTAIGELPPYLAARLRAQAINRTSQKKGRTKETEAQWEIYMKKIVDKMGFFGILLFAAIPNPLFDAAGVASGVAQVPFLSFFGATFIGKAIIKVFIQTSFVILLFHGDNIEVLINYVAAMNRWLVSRVPTLSDMRLDTIIKKFLHDQREQFEGGRSHESPETSTLKTLFGWLIFSMMFLFAISVINSLDKRYRERKSPARKTKKTV